MSTGIQSEAPPAQEIGKPVLGLAEVSGDQVADWDRFVAAQPDGLIYHTSVWKTVVEDAFPHISGRFLALVDQDSGEIVGGIPVYEVDSWILGRRLVSAPFASSCNPLVKNRDALRLLLDGLAQRSQDDGAKRAEVRCIQSGSLGVMGGWEVAERWKHHSTSTVDPPDIIWRRLSRTAVRRMVSKAESQGIEVTADDSPWAVKWFYQYLVEARRRLSLPSIPLKFFVAMFERIPVEQRVLLVARGRGGEVLGGVTGLLSKTTFHLEYAAGDTASRGSGAMQLLYWRALELACERGCENFSFGRTGENNKGLRRYKQHWATREEDIVNMVWEGRVPQRGGNGAMTLAKPVIQRAIGKLPRPVFNMFGEAFYRHWG